MNSDKKKNILEIFKAYDIRGLTPQELNPKIAYSISRAFADFLPKGQVAVGYDMRKDSHKLAVAFMAGLIKQGREVIDLGLITSDMIYYAIGHYKLAGGAMITASHNLAGYDGIKLTGKGVVPIGIDTGLLKIEDQVEHHHFKKLHKHGCDSGKITKKDITKEWVEHALSNVDLNGASLSIATDTGNGMASIVLPYLDELTNIKIESLYTELDGSFPNHPANPLEADNNKNLCKLVVKNHLDCGLAFDGDGDRAFVVDDQGNLLSASVLGAIIARDILERDPGQTILYSATASDILPATIESFGGHSVRTRVGHSFVKAEMKKQRAVFGAEHSGHFYFASNYNADSGLITALTILKIIAEARRPLSEIAAPFVSMFANSGELNYGITDAQDSLMALERHFYNGEADHLDGLTVRYRDWWFNARPSNTESFLRVNIEANNSEIMALHQKEITKLLKHK